MPIAGQPDSIVTFTGLANNPGLVAVWDAGVRRNATIANAVYPTLYGDRVYYQTDFNIRAAKLGPDGLTLEASQRANSFFSWMHATEKWLIDSSGIVYDRATLMAMG
jgi:hypothetical protein